MLGLGPDEMRVTVGVRVRRNEHTGHLFTDGPLGWCPQPHILRRLLCSLKQGCFVQFVGTRMKSGFVQLLLALRLIVESIRVCCVGVLWCAVCARGLLGVPGMSTLCPRHSSKLLFMPSGGRGIEAD